MGILGILVIWLPFAIYFLVNGAFYDYIYASIVFNFAYASKIGSWLQNISSDSVWTICHVYIPFLCMPVILGLAYIRKKYAYVSFLAIMFVLELYLFTSGENFHHYVMPFIFQIGLLLNEMILLKRKSEVYNFCSVGLISLLSVVSLNQMTERIDTLTVNYRKDRNYSAESQDDCDKIMKEQINTIRNSSFVVFNYSPSLKGIYLRYRIIPNNRFLMIQDWHATFTDEAKEQILDDFMLNPPEYVLTDIQDLSNTNSGIGEILLGSYEKVESNETCRLFRRNTTDDGVLKK